MSVRQVKVHGRKVWQARVAFQGLRSSRVCESRDAAKLAQAALLQDLKRRAGQAEQAGLAPATLRQLLDLYALDIEDRGKGEESVGRVDYTRRSIEAQGMFAMGSRVYGGSKKRVREACASPA